MKEDKHIDAGTEGKIHNIITDLQLQTHAALVTIVSRDGLHISSAGSFFDRHTIDATIAMQAMSFGGIETAEGALGNLPPKYLFIEGDKEYIVMVGAGPKALLIFRSEWWSDTDMEQIKKAAEEIKMLLG